MALLVMGIREAVEYAVVRPEMALLDPSKPSSVSDLRYDVALQVQGTAAEIPDGLSPLVSALVMATIYDLSTEAVWRSPDGMLVLLFSHCSVEPLRPDGVRTEVWDEIVRLKEGVVPVSEVPLPSPEIFVDLSEIWGQTEGDFDLVTRTVRFVGILAEHFRPGLILCLKGDLPTLPLLAAVYISRPFGVTIDYADGQEMRVNLFFES
ncbi:MAG: hypothetical protein ABIJ46_00080 [bacterium]